MNRNVEINKTTNENINLNNCLLVYFNAKRHMNLNGIFLVLFISYLLSSISFKLLFIVLFLISYKYLFSI